MNRDVRRGGRVFGRTAIRGQGGWRPRWRVDHRALRPELWLVAAALTGMLLTEVWQSSRMAQECMAVDTAKRALERAEARLAYAKARRDQATTRRELGPVVTALGMVPADAQQVVHLPGSYLAQAEPARPAEETPSVLALAEGAARVLVPEASARVRDTAP